MSSKRTRGLIALLLCAAAPAAAQTRPSTRPIGRISIYAQMLTMIPHDGPATRSVEFVTAIQVAPPDGEHDAVEYAFDMRHRDATNRSDRLSLYDAYVGARFGNGRARLRLGRMWLTDLGGLGSVAGGLAEYRRAGLGAVGSRLRVGVFGGLEPETYGIRNVERVRKVGVYATIEAAAGRRHTTGLIRTGQVGLTERSVLSVSNFMPLRSRVFVYQTAEYDLVSPAGQSGGGLSYMMVNAHGSATERVELQGLYHRGRSIDSRAITEDVLNARPIRPRCARRLVVRIGRRAGGRPRRRGRARARRLCARSQQQRQCPNRPDDAWRVDGERRAHRHRRHVLGLADPPGHRRIPCAIRVGGPPLWLGRLRLRGLLHVVVRGTLHAERWRHD